MRLLLLRWSSERIRSKRPVKRSFYMKYFFSPNCTNHRFISPPLYSSLISKYDEQEGIFMPLLSIRGGLSCQLCMMEWYSSPRRRVYCLWSSDKESKMLSINERNVIYWTYRLRIYSKTIRIFTNSLSFSTYFGRPCSYIHPIERRPLAHIVITLSG